MWRSAARVRAARGGVGGGSEGCVYVELTTSGKAWGRGPTVSDIHGGNKRSVDSPAWRHIKMLASLISEDGNTPLIDGLLRRHGAADAEQMADAAKPAAETIDLKVGGQEPRRRALHVGRPVHDAEDAALRHVVQPRRHLGRQHVCGRRRRDSAEQDHLEAQLPLRAEHERARTSSRSCATQLDKNGYKDVEMKLIGDVPWAKMNSDTDIARAMSAPTKSSTSRTASRRD